MRIDILTLFPEMFDGPFASSIIKRAMDRNLVNIYVNNFRNYARDRHQIVDDCPYGGGAGMVLKPEPIFEAVEDLAGKPYVKNPKKPVILLSPQGRIFDQKIARQLASCENIILICGHYEGFDERIVQHLATDEISIGDYVLSGGEPAAIVMVDAITRLIPGAIDEMSAADDSFSRGLLEYPQYTRPANYRNLSVPDILLSGNHGQIEKWRRMQALKRTLERRPDLLQSAALTKEEEKMLSKLLAEESKKVDI
ncbi:MAG: tRNA (guanosine(37)-N1)-methyltransferase TrmD [Dehalococcoidales bacterium]|jgi:tRNA (guanine37-N1)-methyltransferase|nr:tRNA (guanosine(37)-N1)-methyltransferase TrmD [Dehalococcoidales bacterium]MDD4230085.1 tRNA (guanosine(37)-N1)-methyltransferase TrmD [Dehalococcoidales bacterium]MDD4465297.1 tRNA (guanosine(37)-N1)-methyltransferase TrmD [Dehalococcoidales bacterium]MDD5402159.1 tRNA (guanosine(37)-N1)-methyltransferase TrmD [Dehalococcoidales bacterium]